VVLELDGPAYQQSLERARRHLADEAATAAADPNRKAAENRINAALKLFQSEERHNSRLFVVDAGLDATALRTQYPDRSRYVISSGVVWPRGPTKGGLSTTTGYLERINIGEINVPHAFRSRFEAVDSSTGANSSKAPFTTTITFGQRLEPWIVEIGAPE
jgi:hypothetical protein